LRSQAFLLAGLSFLLFAAEAHAQSKYSPEGTWMRMVIAVVVALLLLISILRGAPARGSRRWFWEASADELGPELSARRSKAFDYIFGGAALLAIAVLMAGHAVYMAVKRDESILERFRQMSGSTLIVMTSLAALGIFVLIRGLRMAPEEPPKP